MKRQLTPKIWARHTHVIIAIFISLAQLITSADKMREDCLTNC